jgi:hypothetical protein
VSVASRVRAGQAYHDLDLLWVMREVYCQLKNSFEAKLAGVLQDRLVAIGTKVMSQVSYSHCLDLLRLLPLG